MVNNKKIKKDAKNHIVIVKKPWGEEHIFAATKDYLGKIFYVKKNHRLALGYHLIKDETIFLLKGRAKVELENKKGQFSEILLSKEESIRIKNGIKHRFTALEDCKVLEVSTGEANDLVRFADDYGRETDNREYTESVCCIGGVCVNLLLSTLNEVPRFGTATVTNKMILRSAGESLNIAFPLANLGIPVSVIANISDDEYGKTIFRDILKHPISIEGISLIRNDKTGLTVCLINESGDRSIIDYPGLKLKMTESMIKSRMDIVEKSKYLYLGGYYNHPGIGFKGYKNILNKFKKMDKITFLDPCWDPKNFNNQSIKDILEILKSVDVFLPNYEEGKAISKKENPYEIIEFFRKEGIKSIFLKLGQKGSIGYFNGKVKTQKALPTSVKDTVGAGDAFNAGIIYGMIKGYDLEKILKISTAISSYVISRDEDRYPNYNQLSKVLRKYSISKKEKN